MIYFSTMIPYKLISEPNKPEHWTAKHKRHKRERALFGLGLRNLTPRLPCHVSLTRIAPRALDEDNLIASFKNIRDIISSFLIPGLAPGRADSDDRIEFSYHQSTGKPKEYGISIVIGPPMSLFSRVDALNEKDNQSHQPTEKDQNRPIYLRSKKTHEKKSKSDYGDIKCFRKKHSSLSNQEIEEIIHNAKVFLDSYPKNVSELDRDRKKHLHSSATACIDSLKLILNDLNFSSEPFFS